MRRKKRLKCGWRGHSRSPILLLNFWHLENFMWCSLNLSKRTWHLSTSFLYVVINFNKIRFEILIVSIDLDFTARLKSKLWRNHPFCSFSPSFRSTTMMMMQIQTSASPTLKPLYVQLPNFISQFWSSKGNQVMSILQVDMKMPGGMYVHKPS